MSKNIILNGRIVDDADLAKKRAKLKRKLLSGEMFRAKMDDGKLVQKHNLDTDRNSTTNITLKYNPEIGEFEIVQERKTDDHNIIPIPTSIFI